MKIQPALLMSGMVLCGMVLSPLQARQDPTQPAADNAKMNRSAGTTADQAKNNLSDREVMRQIRREVVKDHSLSTYGHNVKIISQHGKVTLKGPVHSDDEKRTIERYAQKIAGDGNVSDELIVKNDQR